MSAPTILGISDLHGDLPEIPDCDALLIAGDICPDFMVSKMTSTRIIHDNGEQRQRNWLDTKFREWMTGLVDRGIWPVYIAGNHDYVFEKPYLIPNDLPGTYLRDGGTTITFDHGPQYSLKLWGTPWVPHLHGWAFCGTDYALEMRSTIIPDGLDVLLAHTPPHGYLDMTVPKYGSVHAGEEQILKELDRIDPAVYLCGHIHEGRGVAHRNNTVIVNASHMDENYSPDNLRGTVDLTRYIYG